MLDFQRTTNLALFALVTACTPQDADPATETGGDPSTGEPTGPTTDATESAGSTTTSDASSSTGEPDPTSTGDDVTTGGPPTGLDCPGARYVFKETAPDQPVWLSVDSQGHAYAVSVEIDGWRARELDPAGGLVNTIELNRAQDSLFWGGSDAANDLYFMYRGITEPPVTRGVRKFTGDAPVWVKDLGMLDDSTAVLGIALAPDGSTVVSERTPEDHAHLVKLDADGAVVWDLEQPDELHVLAVNDAGMMAAVRPGDSQLLGLNPDATVAWMQDLPVGLARWGAIDATGNVLYAESTGLDGKKAWRVTAAGELAWELAAPSPLDIVWDVSANAAGELAISARDTEDPGKNYVARLDAAGELVSMHYCADDEAVAPIDAPAAAIDDAGAVYLYGAKYDDLNMVLSYTYVAAFD